MNNFIPKDKVSNEIASLLNVSTEQLKSLPCYKQLEIMILGEHDYIFDSYEQAYRNIELNNAAKSLLNNALPAAGYEHKQIKEIRSFIYNNCNGFIKTANVNPEQVQITNERGMKYVFNNSKS